MDRLKTFLIDRFEIVLVVALLLSVELIFFYASSKTAFLGFYYLPVLLAGFYLGKRTAVLTAIATVLLVVLFFLVWPVFMLAESEFNEIVLDLTIWGFFLVLTASLIGTLYDQKQHHVSNLKVAYVGVLEILTKYLESHDRYTKGHSLRVAEYAVETAIAMGLPRHEVENIRAGALLHDIGKIDVSLELLQKSARLSKEEKEFIDHHSEKGAQLLGLVGSVLEEAIPIVLAHHKHYADEDGINDAPIGARVVAVADAFDAMTTDRPYQAAKPAWTALAEIENQSGRKFDPSVVAAFKTVIEHSANDPSLAHAAPT